MGNLGYLVADGEWIVPDKSVAKPVAPQLRFVVAESPTQTEAPIDKALAYISYYVMVFVASCVFIPLQTASAMAMAKDLIIPDFLTSHSTQYVKADQPLLRQGNIFVLEIGPAVGIELRGTVN